MDREHEELLMRYMDGEMDEQSLDRLQSLLRSDREFQEEFLKLSRQERVLRVLLGKDQREMTTRQVLNEIKAQETGAAFVDRVQKEITGRQLRISRPPRPGSSRTRNSIRSRRAGSRHSQAWAMPLAAAAMLLLAFGLFLVSRKNTPQSDYVALVSAVSGKEVLANGPAGSRALKSGAELSVGDVLRSGADSEISFKYRDGTSVQLNASSVLEIKPAENAAKQLSLNSGSLLADVQPQPEGSPFKVTTPQAQATVRGTVLSLSVTSSETRLDVRRGKVNLERLADRAELLVTDGHFAIAGRDTSIAMKSSEIASAPAVVAQVAPLRDGTAEDFISRVHQGQGVKLPYRLFVPLNYDKNRKYPLVLFLHGLGEKGTDNKKPLAKNALGAMTFVSGKNQTEHPCFMLVPQSESGWWAEYFPALTQVLSDLPKEFSIDTDRLYITGLSFGGTGTWQFAVRQPNLFAAAVPICGAGEPAKAGAITALPVWNFHTADDPTMKVQGSRAMIDAIRKAGGSPYYTEYAKGGHGSAWTRAFQEPGLIPWLMAQKKGKAATAPNPLPFPR